MWCGCGCDIRIAGCEGGAGEGTDEVAITSRGTPSSHCATLAQATVQHPLHTRGSTSWLPRMRCTLRGCSILSASSRQMVSKLWLPLQRSAASGIGHTEGLPNPTNTDTNPRCQSVIDSSVGWGLADRPCCVLACRLRAFGLCWSHVHIKLPSAVLTGVHHHHLNSSSSGRPVGCMSTFLKQHLNTHKQQLRVRCCS